MRLGLLLALLICVAVAAPVAIPELKDLTGDSGGVDTTKNYVLYIYDSHVCEGQSTKCADLESSVQSVAASITDTEALAKYHDNLVFAKVNKDNFPEHKKEFEKAKLAMPALVFWPSGHFKPSCKLDSPHPTASVISTWLSTNLKAEEALLQVDPATLVCKVEDKSERSVAETSDVTCADAAEDKSNSAQGLMQLEKTQKIWDFKTAQTQFLGPADNSLPYTIQQNLPTDVQTLDSAGYNSLTKQGKYQALYFSAPWCKYCDCLSPVWAGVSSNLVSTQRQPSLVVSFVDGDASPELRNLFNVTVYPTFLLVNQDGTKVLGRYLGPRKVFQLSTWIEDLIVADQYPIVKHQFNMTEQGTVPDLNPAFPYSGAAAFEPVALAFLSAQITGNDFDECVDSDEAKFTAPGAALLVHYSSDPKAIRALELDSNIVAVGRVPDKLTVIDFFASWCPHCQKLAPVWDSVSSQFSEGVTIGKVDVEAHSDIKKAFGIHRFPTIMYFEPGKPMVADESRRYTGSRDKDSLTHWIEQLKSKH